MNKCELCGSREMNAFHKGVRDDGNIDVLKCEDCGALILEKYVRGGASYIKAN